VASDAVVRSKRLELIPWTIELIDGFLAGDRLQAEATLAVTFSEPFEPPPETGDVLEFFKAGIVSDTSEGAFLARMIVRAVDRIAIGSIGLSAPDDNGVSTFGYGVYPQFEGRGYASEAAVALVDWGLTLPNVRAIRATIPIGHTASEIVSRRAGLTMTGEQIEDEKEGTLNVWERRSG
jgi:RimJ/RimL family protein N-acetyltransferase